MHLIHTALAITRENRGAPKPRRDCTTEVQKAETMLVNSYIPVAENSPQAEWQQ